MSVEWAEFLVGTLLLTVLVPFAKWVLRHWKARRTRNALSKRHDIYMVLQELRDKLSANRVFIMEASNGGKIPTMDRTVMTSILYEHCRFDVVPIHDTWQNEVADQPLAEMLSSITKGKICPYPVEDMAKGKVKTACLALGLTLVVFKGVGATPTKFLYLAATWDDGRNDLGPLQEDAFRVASARISALIDVS